MKTVVIGLGRLGLPVALTLWAAGHEVLAIDANVNVIDSLTSGNSRFDEPGLAEMLNDAKNLGRLEFAYSVDDSSGKFDSAVICTETPAKVDSKELDISSVLRAIDTCMSLLNPSGFVVVKSSLPVGTCETLRKKLKSNLATSGATLYHCPDFLKEGNAISDSLNPSRVVIGCYEPLLVDEAPVRDLWRLPINNGSPVIVTDYLTAELCKTASNSFLALKISYANAISALAGSFGSDPIPLLEVIGLDPRIGPTYLHPGIGYGGSCLSKDLGQITASCSSKGLHASAALFSAVYEVNVSRRDLAARQVMKIGGGNQHLQVGILGAAFKPDVSDIRDSPVIGLVERLIEVGCSVSVFDPEATSIPSMATRCESMTECCTDADIVVFGTPSLEIAGCDPVALGAVVKSRVILDCRYALPKEIWEQAGWKVIRLDDDIPVHDEQMADEYRY